MKREAKFNTTFNHWLKHVYKKTAVFELKQCDTSLPFSAVVEHQRQALLNTRHGTLVYKIPDVGFQNPYDVVCLTEIPSYVVIKFTLGVCIIPIDTFLLAEKRSKRKSITYSEAIKLSTVLFDSPLRKE